MRLFFLASVYQSALAQSKCSDLELDAIMNKGGMFKSFKDCPSEYGEDLIGCVAAALPNDSQSTDCAPCMAEFVSSEAYRSCQKECSSPSEDADCTACVDDLGTLWESHCMNESS